MLAEDVLRSRVGGTVVSRSDPAYEAVRSEMLWNRLQPDRHPEVIIQARSEADVVEAVRFARQQRLGVAVRGRGHSWCGAPLRDGTVLIDLAALAGMDIDAGRGVAAVGPGVTGRTLSSALTAKGFAFPIGHCSAVPLGGFLLSGGIGWNCSTWGPASASVQAVEVVTADGDRITASDSSHPDLFWAARGAGPCFFAVATRFHLALRPLPAAIHTSTYVFPLECADDVSRWASAIDAGRGVEVTLFLFAPPDAPGFVCLLTATAFSDSPGEAQRALQFLSDNPLKHRCLDGIENQPTPFDALLDNVDAMFPGQHRYLADNAWTAAPAGDIVALLRERLTAAPSRKSGILCMLSGLPAQLPDMAFGLRDRTYFGCYAIWDNPADDYANRAWFRATVRVLEQRATGHYLGECDLDADPSRAARSFTADAWRRLGEIGRRYDSAELFTGMSEFNGRLRLTLP